MKKAIFYNILIIFVLTVTNSYAGQSKAFFEKGSAKSVFLPESKLTNQQELEYFRVKEEEKDVEDKDDINNKNNKDLVKNEESKKDVLQNNDIGNGQKELTASEKIIAKYGDPNEDVTYYPEEKAPTPFKGIMAALQAGDEELAYKYAKQYINYTAKESDLVGKTIVFQKLALEGLGRAKQGEYSNDLDAAQYKYLLEKELKEKKEKEERERQLAKAVTLTSKETSLFDSFSDAYERQIQRTNKEAISHYEEMEARKQEKIKNGELVEKEETIEEKGENLIKRASIRNEYVGRVPVDPQGEVSIYFFFKPNEEGSMALGRRVEELYKQNVKEQNVHIVGVNVDGLPLASFKNATKANFPILTGDRLSKLMGIKTFPSIFFRCETTGEAFVFNKPAREFELGEILSLMRGER